MGIWTWIWTRPPKGTDQLFECKVTGWPLPKSPVATEKPAGTAGTWESEDSGSQAVSSKGHPSISHTGPRGPTTPISAGAVGLEQTQGWSVWARLRHTEGPHQPEGRLAHQAG